VDRNIFLVGLKRLASFSGGVESRNSIICTNLALLCVSAGPLRCYFVKNNE
jgi:hypothetical protein